MATLQQIPQPQVVEIPKKHPVVPIKVGLFGGQGAGKSTTAALLALALSKEFYNSAPVAVTDTEPGWQFLRRLFQIEGVELIQTTTPTFKAMLQDLRAAEKRGCCVWAVDSLTVIWNEVLKSAKGDRSYIPIDQWQSIKSVWGEYTTAFLNSGMNCLALGRLGNDFEEQADADTGKISLVKTGTKFKAGGGESFGYEPHLLLELSLERKAKKKGGEKLEGEGRMIHRADVLKDRTWALNGNVIRWTDKAKYEKGGYRQVWSSLKPHFDLVQQTMARVTLQTGQDSQEFFDTNGDSEFYQKRQRKDVLSAELHASMEYLWGGMSADAKKLRMDVFEHVFGFRSKEAADAASLDTIERGVRILQLFEKPIKEGTAKLPSDREETLKALDLVIGAYESGSGQDSDLPF